VQEPKRQRLQFFDVVSAAEKTRLDKLWAESVFTNNWSFNAVENPFLKEFFKAIRPGWQPPSAYQLSHGLLDETYSGVSKEIKETMAKATSFTLQLDGWSDVNSASLINVAVYAGQPIFLQSIDPGIQRHDANFIKDTVLGVIDAQIEAGVSADKFRAVVTDQPTVMTSAWQLLEASRPGMVCYGCGAHVVNLLASDFRKLPVVNETLQKNQQLSKFFKHHNFARETLQKITKDKFGRPLKTVLSCATRWATDYFMVRRNLRIKPALVCAAVDDSLARSFKVTSANGDVKKDILSDDFWRATEQISQLLQPLSTAIRYCEGNNVPVSVMPHIWGHVTEQVSHEKLSKSGWEDADIEQILTAVDHRKGMNIRPVTLAAYALDPRFHTGTQLSLTDDEWRVASKFIVDFAEREGQRRLDVLSDLAHFRAKTGAVFGDGITWEAVWSSACSLNPECWWSTFASNSHLSKSARILLSMPATSAIIERCNKAYGMQKTKTRNRLSPTRASKLAVVSYNLKVNKSITAPNRRCERRQLSILALSSSRACESTASANPEELPALPCLNPVTDGATCTVPPSSSAADDESDSADSDCSDNEMDPGEDSGADDVDDSGGTDEDTEDHGDDELALTKVNLLKGK